MQKIKELEKNRFSILTNDLTKCYICGKSKDHLHEIFFGKNRVNSMKWGCVAPLCYQCHSLIHRKPEVDIMLKKECQQKFEQVYPNEDFLNIFHKYYI